MGIGWKNVEGRIMQKSLETESVLFLSACFVARCFSSIVQSLSRKSNQSEGGCNALRSCWAWECTVRSCLLAEARALVQSRVTGKAPPGAGESIDVPLKVYCGPGSLSGKMRYAVTVSTSAVPGRAPGSGSSVCGERHRRFRISARVLDY